MIESIKTAHGSIAVRTSCDQIEFRTYVQAAPNSITVLYLNADQAEALQNALGRLRGMLPCPHYREALEAVSG